MFREAFISSECFNTGKSLFQFSIVKESVYRFVAVIADQYLFLLGTTTLLGH